MENRYSLFGTDCEEGIRVFFSVWRTVRLAQVRGGRVMVPLWNGIGSWEEEGRSHPLMVMGDGGGGDRGSGVPFFVVNSGDDDARRYFQVRFQRFFCFRKIYHQTWRMGHQEEKKTECVNTSTSFKESQTCRWKIVFRRRKEGRIRKNFCSRHRQTFGEGEATEQK